MCDDLHRTVVLSIGLIDFGFSIYESYSGSSGQSIGTSAHIGGALAGFFVGINALRNFHAKVLKVCSVSYLLMLLSSCGSTEVH